MPDEAPFEEISKIEAAERQLSVAIRLFFERRDLVAVHTLAAAAKGILQDLCHSRGIKGIFEDSDLIRPEKKQELIQIWRQPQNFFKHAGKDGDKNLKFYYETTKFVIFEAAWLSLQMTGRVFPVAGIFLSWFIVKFPYLLQEGLFKEGIKQKGKVLDPDDFPSLLLALDLISQHNEWPPRGANTGG